MALDPIGTSELVLSVNDKQLVTALKANEQRITQSTAKMQGSLDRVSASFNKGGQAAFDAGKGVGALSNSAALLSGSLGGTVSRGVAAIQMFQMLSASVKATSLAFLATGVGLLVAVIAFRTEITAALEKGLTFLGFMEDLEPRVEAAAKAFEKFKVSMSFENKLDALRDRFKNVTGEMTQQRLEFRALLRESEILTPGQAGQISSLQQGIRDVATAKARVAAEAALAAQIAAVNREGRIRLGIEGEFDHIQDEVLRKTMQRLALLKDEIELKRRAADEEKALLATEKARTAELVQLKQQLLIGAGLARSFQFEDDPEKRRLLRLLDELSRQDSSARAPTTRTSRDILGGGIGGPTGIGTAEAKRTRDVAAILKVAGDILKDSRRQRRGAA